MKPSNWGLIGFLTVLSLASIVYANPMSWGIAIKNETRSCAGYWGGDGNINYTLPNGWVDYYPNYDNGLVDDNRIITPFGECKFNIDAEDECCRQLNLTFVSKNIGVGAVEENNAENVLALLKNPYVILVIVVSFILIVAIIKYI